MELAGKRYITHNSRTDKFKIWGLGDFHVGNRGCALEHIKATVKEIQDDPCSFVVGTGDYSDCISYTDMKRFDPNTIDPSLTVADLANLGMVLNTKVRDILKPISHKIIGLLIGNHELEYQRRKDQTGNHAWLCRELGVNDLGYSCFVDLTFVRTGKSNCETPAIYNENPVSFKDSTRSTFRLFAHHGGGASSTPGSKLNQLIKLAKTTDADLFMMGHVHDIIGKRIPIMAVNGSCNGFAGREKACLVTGSFLKTYGHGYTGYGEQRMYEPVVLGSSFIQIEPTSRKLRIEV